jgi:hypothetical protein
MKKAWWPALALACILSGCAATGAGTPATPPGSYYGPGYSTVPPSWYNYDPNMAKWYEPPYFNPYYPNF